ELLEAPLVQFETERSVAELPVDVRLPQIGRFEDVPVGVDGTIDLDAVVVMNRFAGCNGNSHGDPSPVANSTSAGSYGSGRTLLSVRGMGRGGAGTTRDIR